MKKIIKYIIFLIMIFIFQTKVIFAAQELTCIYKGAKLLGVSSTMLYQDASGKITIMTNQNGSVDKDNKNWKNPATFSNASIVTNFDTTKYSNGGLTGCPKYTNFKGTQQKNKNIYNFYFYDTKKFLKADYELDKELLNKAPDNDNYEKNFDDAKANKKVIANNEWIAVCNYEKVDLYIGYDKFVLDNKDPNVSRTTAGFSYNQLKNRYRGACPSLYMEIVLPAQIGYGAWVKWYLTEASNSHKSEIIGTDIKDPNYLFNDMGYTPEVIEQTCETLLGSAKADGKTDVKGNGVIPPASPAYYLHVVFNVLKYVAIVLVVVLSVIDFVGATANHDNDQLKKVVGKIIKRLIFCIIIFLLPTILDFLLQFITIGENGSVTISACGIGG